MSYITSSLVKGIFLVTFLVFSLNVSAQVSHTPQAADESIDAILHEYDKQIFFTENKGQFNDAVVYRADFPLGQALATEDGMLVKIYDPSSVSRRAAEALKIEEDILRGLSREMTAPLKGHGWLMRFVNSSDKMKVGSRGAHDELQNYFIGDRSSHATDVRSYQEVWYRDVYENVDVRYYPAANGSLEYDIICMPGSDPSSVALAFDGIEGMYLDPEGNLRLPNSVGELSIPTSYVYQVVRGKERRVSSTYVIKEGNLQFELGEYDPELPLVIDPIALRWATWINTNSSNDNHGHGIWVDPSDGAIYIVARVTGTTDLITIGAFNTTPNGSLDIIVGKYLEPTTVGGTGTRVWQTYLGGSGSDNPYALEQGVDGHLYITGYTRSSDYPLLGGPIFSGASIDNRAQVTDNIFVTKMNTAGNSIKSAVLGGDGDDDSFDLRTTPSGDVIVCGKTSSVNLLTLHPGSGASNTNNGSQDVILFSLNQNLSAVNWIHNYGGDDSDYAMIMLNSAAGDIYVGGYTQSSDFPTLSPRQATLGGDQDGFLQRLTSSGAFTWSSYFRSGNNDDSRILCMEFNTAQDEIYFGGATEGLASSNITTGIYDQTYNGGTNDLFAGRITIGQTLVGSTYLGGGGNEINMMGLNVDLNDDVYIFGYSNSTDFPVTASPNTALQSSNGGGFDKVFAKITADLATLEFSTYYGGADDEYDPVGERGIKFSNCRIYTIVSAESDDIPLTDGALNTNKLSGSSTYEPGLVVWANPPDLLTNSIIGDQVICSGGIPNDISGSVPSYTLPTIIRDGQTSAYPSLGAAATYQWQVSTDSIVWTDIVGATSQDLSGAAIGVVTQDTYVRRVIGGDACILAGAADQIVSVQLVGVTATVTDVDCYGAATGAITANPSGQAPFNYQWSNGSTTQTITGLTQGLYWVLVTDMNQCQVIDTFPVSQPPPLMSSVTVTDATCAQSNGSASVAVSGGTAPYTYAWDNGSTTAGIVGVPSGTYIVTISDAHGCMKLDSAMIGSSGLPVANAGSDMIIDCSTAPSVMLNGSSPTLGVSYSWLASAGGNIVNGASTATPTVNAAGSYTLTVTLPSTGCSSSDIATVSVDTLVPSISVSVNGQLTCDVSSVILNGSSVTVGATFAWTGPGGFTSALASPSVSEPGTYSLIVTDPSNSCMANSDLIVSQDSLSPILTLSAGTLDCNTATTTVSASSSIPAVTYAWSASNGGHIVSGANVSTAVVDAQGTYSVVVTVIASGCSTSDSVQISLNSTAPTASATGGFLDCTTGMLQLDGASTTNGASYYWTGPNGFTSPAEDPLVSDTGTYVLVVTGPNGCTGTDNAYVGDDCNPCPLIYSCAPDTVISCGTSLNWEDLGAPDFQKDPNCAFQTAFVSWFDTLSGNCPTVLQRTWIAYDVQGNSESCVQTITMIDTLAPWLIGLMNDTTVAYNMVPIPPVVTAMDACDGPLAAVFNEQTIPTGDPKEYTLIRTWTAMDNCGNTTVGTQTVIATELGVPKIQIRAMLEGAATSGNANAGFAANGLFQTSDPYGLGYTVSAAVLNATGAQTPVDWLLIELRDPVDPRITVFQLAAVLQSDGKVVDVDGSDVIKFNISMGHYMVVVDHYNHLGIASEQALNLATLQMLDFTDPATAVYEKNDDPLKYFGGQMVMWMGDTNGDNIIKYTGANNDRDPILIAIGGASLTTTVSGWFVEDVRLNGDVKYMGADNDRDPILVNIGGSIPTALRKAQLP